MNGPSLHEELSESDDLGSGLGLRPETRAVRRADPRKGPGRRAVGGIAGPL